MRHFLIYKTTNNINKMFYIGKHETDNINDGYIGSGRKLLEAIKEFGKINFTCKIIYKFKTREEMNNKEKEIVNPKFLQRKDIYNINIGGTGWKSFVNTKEINDRRLKTMMSKIEDYYKYSKIGTEKLNLLLSNKEYLKN